MAAKKKPTQAQILANRANAKKSTGPKTAEGKRRSAENAKKSTGPRTAKGKARSAFNALKDGTWSEPSWLRVCIGCRKKCLHSWPPKECVEEALAKGRVKPEDLPDKPKDPDN